MIRIDRFCGGRAHPTTYRMSLFVPDPACDSGYDRLIIDFVVGLALEVVSFGEFAIADEGAGDAGKGHRKWSAERS